MLGPEMCWAIRGMSVSLTPRPWVMGIVNVTPDSFSDGGDFLPTEAAVRHGLDLASQGAQILDIGGESTRPGASPVPLAEELQRVIPVIEQLARQVRVPMSVDTYKAEVARQALLAGAAIVNDISGLQFDPQMIDVCRDLTAGIICMHIQGTPQTMQQAPHYDNVIDEIVDYFRERLSILEAAGIPAERIVFDPGIGFGKTAEHNVEILANVQRFRSELGRPILIGHSRKRFLGRVIARKVDERLFGTVGVSLAVAQQGADLIRVHEVAAACDSLTAWRTINDWNASRTLPH